MTDTTQTAMAAGWLVATLLLLLRYMRQGIRKGGKCDAVQPRTGPKLAVENRSGPSGDI